MKKQIHDIIRMTSKYKFKKNYKTQISNDKLKKKIKKLRLYTNLIFFYYSWLCIKAQTS
jgi:hypothetical protein